MKQLRKTIFVCGLVLVNIVHCANILDTQIRSGGQVVHLVETRIKDGILSIYLMVKNTSDSGGYFSNFNVNDIHYIADGRRYPVLQDAKKKWFASPFGFDYLFFNRYSDTLHIDSGKSIIGWIKLEAPEDHQWPIELNLPESLPFVIERPE